MVLLDLQKAFDTVDHSKLLMKLRASGLGDDITKWLQSHLSDRKQLVDVSVSDKSISTVEKILSDDLSKSLGGNDINCGIGINSRIVPLTVASTLKEIGVLLLKDYNVKQVILCELFTRAKPRNVSVEEYEAKRRHINSILKTLLESHASITFWSQRRIFGAQTQIFAADGVHLTQFGQHRFYRSLRHAVMRAVKNYTKTFLREYNLRCL
ncbi:hypothetical protein DPMN_015438 [Dreissena polymorpha]|uniref:Reverse transcriptase domain-containing protein n=1 Tax=Dreissena polymorpha TaxID=45954 RepID=A0A9D4S3M1_DREPO|nr:hypothetical protein DPMN_015438 [Dreissena polymorpha]